ncbi:hypothetical protein E2C01_095400 [Portunus trituberculatus]|uniref:Uncharacterized protein n=1 Tax=Portunus trituberculatus TaxID=210409 RepID=A0A5B7K020_PORTR|nr:hypothetical protein [Portunus trituberculatus]
MSKICVRVMPSWITIGLDAFLTGLTFLSYPVIKESRSRFSSFISSLIFLSELVSPLVPEVVVVLVVEVEAVKEVEEDEEDEVALLLPGERKETKNHTLCKYNQL